MINPNALRTVAEFRVLRDFYAWQRREQVLPQLKRLECRLNGRIRALRRRIERMGVKPTKGLPWEQFQLNLQHNHKRDGIYAKILEMSWAYQDVVAEIAVIEKEHAVLTASVPANWRAQVFAVGTEGDSELPAA